MSDLAYRPQIIASGLAAVSTLSDMQSIDVFEIHAGEWVLFVETDSNCIGYLDTSKWCLSLPNLQTQMSLISDGKAQFPYFAVILYQSLQGLIGWFDRVIEATPALKPRTG